MRRSPVRPALIVDPLLDQGDVRPGPAGEVDHPSAGPQLQHFDRSRAGGGVKRAFKVGQS